MSVPNVQTLPDGPSIHTLDDVLATFRRTKRVQIIKPQAAGLIR